MRLGPDGGSVVRAICSPSGVEECGSLRVDLAASLEFKFGQDAFILPGVIT